ncbi:hypothetical protein BDZ94DRAFT_1177986 [Collybia nuda]|uniref:RING-type domain-containing protein n=1 Tax=Collybia nuda TaxID=64659 RepID=A0A9P6CCS9_9AGAR|nr:hypothetical protein BDZ94DRAFT_1177986 [Collybia nuda]
MLTLTPGSSCDVCAEEYGPHCQPHSIPCGHVLCLSCCSTIVEKTSPRLTPVCPFCREHFTSDSARLIRMDFNTSGWSTPRRLPTIESNNTDFADMWARKTERLLLSEGSSRTRSETRRLEDKVAKVAAKRCSVEEVSTLHKELEEWLTSEKDDTTSLYLSAALLRAILMNHLAHSEASRNAKTIEANLKAKLDDAEITNGKLETELRKQRALYTQKTQECQTMRTELSRLKALATTLGTAPSDPRQSTSPPTSPVPPYSPSAQSPLSRFSSVHVRSASMSSRPSTPSMSSPTRSHTPAPPPTRSQTPSIRSQTPSIRSYTPAPPSLRPTPAPLRMQTPAPPPVPHKPRRLSTPSPPKMMRSTSEEKADVHERWFPATMEQDQHKSKYASRPPSRASYSTSSIAAAARYRSPSPHS